MILIILRTNAIILLLITIRCSAFFTMVKLWVRIVLVIIAAGVTIQIARIKPNKKIAS